MASKYAHGCHEFGEKKKSIFDNPMESCGVLNEACPQKIQKKLNRL